MIRCPRCGYEFTTRTLDSEQAAEMGRKSRRHLSSEQARRMQKKSAKARVRHARKKRADDAAY